MPGGAPPAWPRRRRDGRCVRRRPAGQDRARHPRALPPLPRSCARVTREVFASPMRWWSRPRSRLAPTDSSPRMRGGRRSPCRSRSSLRAHRRDDSAFDLEARSNELAGLERSIPAPSATRRPSPSSEGAHDRIVRASPCSPWPSSWGSRPTSCSAATPSASTSPSTSPSCWSRARWPPGPPGSGASTGSTRGWRPRPSPSPPSSRSAPIPRSSRSTSCGAVILGGAALASLGGRALMRADAGQIVATAGEMAARHGHRGDPRRRRPSASPGRADGAGGAGLGRARCCAALLVATPLLLVFVALFAEADAVFAAAAGRVLALPFDLPVAELAERSASVAVVAWIAAGVLVAAAGFWVLVSPPADAGRLRPADRHAAGPATGAMPRGVAGRRAERSDRRSTARAASGSATPRPSSSSSWWTCSSPPSSRSRSPTSSAASTRWPRPA